MLHGVNIFASAFTGSPSFCRQPWDHHGSAFFLSLFMGSPLSIGIIGITIFHHPWGCPLSIVFHGIPSFHCHLRDHHLSISIHGITIFPSPSAGSPSFLSPSMGSPSFHWHPWDCNFVACIHSIVISPSLSVNHTFSQPSFNSTGSIIEQLWSFYKDEHRGNW